MSRKGKTEKDGRKKKGCEDKKKGRRIQVTGNKEKSPSLTQSSLRFPNKIALGFFPCRREWYNCLHKLLHYVLHPSFLASSFSIYPYFHTLSVLRSHTILDATFLGLLQQRHSLFPRWRHDKSLTTSYRP